MRGGMRIGGNRWLVRHWKCFGESIWIIIRSVVSYCYSACTAAGIEQVVVDPGINVHYMPVLYRRQNGNRDLTCSCASSPCTHYPLMDVSGIRDLNVIGTAASGPSASSMGTAVWSTRRDKGTD